MALINPLCRLALPLRHVVFRQTDSTPKKIHRCYLRWNKSRLSVVIVPFLLLLSMLTIPLPVNAQFSGQRCFAVSDESDSDTLNRLIEGDVNTGITRQVGIIGGGDNIEAISLVPSGESFTIYAANANTFGTINPVTAQYSPRGSFAVAPDADDPGGRDKAQGRIDGSKKSVTLNDIDSLTYDSSQGIMYGAHRRQGDFDLLFKMDLTRPSGGFVIGNAFDDPEDVGETVDFVQIKSTDGQTVNGVNVGSLKDVDDIAIHPKIPATVALDPNDPSTWRLYAVINTTGENSGQDSALAVIDPQNGDIVQAFEIMTINPDTGAPVKINDIEGLAFSSQTTPELFGSTGDNGPKGFDQNQLFKIPLPVAGATQVMAEAVAQFDPSAKDVEGLGCLTGEEPPPPCEPKIPAITLEKSTNGEDADTAPGPVLIEGDPINWEYVVTNTGETALTNIGVTDDKLPAGSISCPSTSLAVGESMICTANGTATLGQYENTATVTASGVDEDPTDECTVPDVSASDPSHYLGVDRPIPGIDVEKSTNGVDADSPEEGPVLVTNCPVEWTYVVTNNGNIPLTNVTLMDDQLGPIQLTQNMLAVGESVTVTTPVTMVTAGPYSNLATVAAESSAGNVGDTDPSHYNGVVAQVEIQKSTNGQDSDAAPGQNIATGALVTWSYEVMNTGNVDLRDIVVVDDQLGAVDCGGITTLAQGASMTCTATGPAGTGPYENLATVLAVPDVAGGESCRINSSDPSHYEGAGELRGTQISTVTWSYVITNTGDVTLTNVSLDGGFGVEITPNCIDVTLPSGASLTCGAAGGPADFGNDAILTAMFDGTELMSTVPGPLLDGLQMLINTDSSLVVSGDVQVSGTGTGGDKFVVGSNVPLDFKIANQGPVTIGDINADFIDIVTGARQSLSCPQSELAPGESMSCPATTQAREGQNDIIGTVTGIRTGTQEPVFANTSGFYEGVSFATIGGRLFIDELNVFDKANGIQDLGERSLSAENVEIDLFDADSEELVDEGGVDSNGNYEFSDLMPGNYYILARRPLVVGTAFQGFIWAAVNQLNDWIDSDADPAMNSDPNFARTGNFLVKSGEVDNSRDIGFEQIIFTGRAFVDEDGDQEYDDGETVVSGATITVFDALNPGGQATMACGTDSRGVYSCGAIDPGIYDVTATHPNYSFESVGVPGGAAGTINFVASAKSGIYIPVITSPAVGGGK